MTPQQERAFDQKVDKHFRSHRDTPSGRNFATWNHPNFAESKKLLNAGYDETFPTAVMSPSWFEKTFCSKCDLRKVHCTCK